MTTTTAAPATKKAGLGAAAVVGAVVAWGASSVFVKQIETIDALAISSLRMVIGAVFTIAVFMLGGGRISRRQLRLSLPGGVAFGLDIVLFFAALKNTTVANATVIGALQPVLMLFVAPRLFGEHARRSEIVWSLIAVMGTGAVVLGATKQAGSGMTGDVLAVGALLAWCWYFVESKRARVELTSLEYLTGLLIVATVILLPVAAVLADPLLPTSSNDWWNLAGLALLSGGTGHFLMNWAHAHLRLQIASLLTLGVPVVSTAAAYAVLHEEVTLLQLAGMTVVIVSLGIVVAGTGRAAPASPLAPSTEEEIGGSEATGH